MVAPVDSKAELMVEGETFVLRLNFRTLALLEQSGLDPFTAGGIAMTTVKLAMTIMALTIEDHPDLSDKDALAIVWRSKGAAATKVQEVFSRFGGTPDNEDELGNGNPGTTPPDQKPSTTSSSPGSKRASRRKTSGAKPRATTN